MDIRSDRSLAGAVKKVDLYQAYGPVPMITSDTDICYNAECSNGSICPLWTGQVSGPLAKRGALSLILLSGPAPF